MKVNNGRERTLTGHLNVTLTGHLNVTLTGHLNVTLTGHLNVTLTGHLNVTAILIRFDSEKNFHFVDLLNSFTKKLFMKISL